MHSRPLLFLLLLTLLATAARAQIRQTFQGNASYYSPRAHGHMTASGERYDKDGYTCAHRSLPFGTILRVTNLRNDSVVLVKVNDRGPFARTRVIDLSTAAARRLDIINHGVAHVKVEVMPSELEIWMERREYKLSELPDYMKEFQLDPPDVRMEMQWPEGWLPGERAKKSAAPAKKKSASEPAKRPTASEPAKKSATEPAKRPAAADPAKKAAAEGAQKAPEKGAKKSAAPVRKPAGATDKK